MDLVSIESGSVRLSVPTRFLKSWIESHYAGHVLASLQEEMPHVRRVNLAVRTPVRRAAPAKQEAPPLKAPHARKPPDLPAPDTANRQVQGSACPPEPIRLIVEDIQRAVAMHYGIMRSDISGRQRTADIARPRQMAIYLIKTLTSLSFSEIGKYFGGRDHTTVLHSFNKVAWNIGERGEKPPGRIGKLRAEVDYALKEEVESLKKQLLE